jgi:Flp pilus assembly pilin Flp
MSMHDDNSTNDRQLLGCELCRAVVAAPRRRVASVAQASLLSNVFRAPSGVPVSAKGGESIVSFTDLYTYLRARFVREEGQTMAEYGVVLAVIALTVILAFTALSGGISNAINNVTKVLNG